MVVGERPSSPNSVPGIGNQTPIRTPLINGARTAGASDRATLNHPTSPLDVFVEGGGLEGGMTGFSLPVQNGQVVIQGVRKVEI